MGQRAGEWRRERRYSWPMETVARLTGDGGQIITSTPDHFAAYIKSEIGRFAKIVKESGAKVE